MSSLFKTISITGKPNDSAAVETIRRIAEHLIEGGYDVRLDGEIVPGTDSPQPQLVDRAQLVAGCDLMISVGGDGTLLNSARMLVDHDVPILGVNRGRLGFLVDVSPNDLTELDTVLAGDFIEDRRSLLIAEVRRAGEVLDSGIALNDVVLYKWNTARLIEFTTYIDGQLLTDHRADGLVVATPTGSTAYAMASGGPIIHPGVDAMVLVPICPHTLSNRPLAIAASSEVALEMHPDSYGRVSASCDGQDGLDLEPGSRLVIRQHPRKVRLLHPPRYQYYNILRAKLRWGDTNVR